MAKSAITFQQVERARRNFRNAVSAYTKTGKRYHFPAPQLADRNIRNCRIVESRYKILEFLPSNGIVAEIGVDQGLFSKSILQTCSPKKLHLIDIDLGRLDQSNVRDAIADGRCELHGGDSSSMLMQFPDAYFDWVYIDGDHYYEGVKRDIDAAKAKIKPGGLLAFNDYTVWSAQGMTHCGVARAVNEFCLAENWELLFFSFQSMFYNDVVIRKIMVPEVSL